MQKIVPFLTFQSEAEEAVKLYTSVFKNSKILSTTYYPEGSPRGKAGTVMSIKFELEGQPFCALNGGQGFSFSSGISFFVNCETQEEVDHLWGKLTEGGKELPCGWLEDKFGVSWQIIPTILFPLLNHEDKEKAGKATQAMLGMGKLDIAALKKAAES